MGQADGGFRSCQPDSEPARSAPHRGREDSASREGENKKPSRRDARSIQECDKDQSPWSYHRLDSPFASVALKARLMIAASSGRPSQLDSLLLRPPRKRVSTLPTAFPSPYISSLPSRYTCTFSLFRTKRAWCHFHRSALVLPVSVSFSLVKIN